MLMEDTKSRDNDSLDHIMFLKMILKKSNSVKMTNKRNIRYRQKSSSDFSLFQKHFHLFENQDNFYFPLF